MRVVVTGGAGFIGANLGRTLLTHPQITDVVALDDLSTGDATNLSGTEMKLVRASVLDPEALDSTFSGTSCVVHLAAIPSVPRSIADPMHTHQVNVTGTVEVLQAARRVGVRHLIVASSSSVYGANQELPKRESMRPDPLSPYAVSKLASEMYAMSFARCFDMKVLAIRFFNVFGPFQSAGHAYAAVTPNFVQAALTGKPLVVFGDGEQTRDFTYVGTLCDLMAQAVVGQVSSDSPVNGAFGGRVSLNEFIRVLAEVAAAPVRVEYTDPRPGDVRDSQADNTRLRDLFRNVHPVSLRDGLEQTVTWYRGRLSE